jgi:predicted  nucleic acid-binding Zn-ribbon protein
MEEYKKKSFWKRPEGKTGLIVLIAFVIGGGILLFNVLPAIIALTKSILGLSAMLFVLGAIVYMIIDPRTRKLFWYMYKSVMRWITGVFVQIDPIGILKSYVEDLKGNLSKMNKQISRLRGQMHKLKELILNNQKEIRSNLDLASRARDNDKKSVMILKSRKAGRLRDSNIRLEDLYRKMEIMYRVLTKMYENSEILMEDIKDQVEVKEQERKAIHASHSAMNSAMSLIAGDSDKRAMFDQALEAIADDVGQKMGEMERFMEVSENFMQSVDLKNGIFEEEGLKMLEIWETEGASRILGDDKETLLIEAMDDENVLDLDAPMKRPVRAGDHRNQYDTFFD